MTIETKTEQFLNAVRGARGELDAWLERNNGAEVREAILGAIEAEREACAKVCESYDNRIESLRDSEYQAELAGRQAGAMRCAAAIRFGKGIGGVILIGSWSAMILYSLFTFARLLFR